MAEQKARKKGKTQWWVVTEGKDEQLVTHYTGPDKTRARETAQKLLSDNDEVGILKVAARVTLTNDKLVASLPKDSF